MKTETQLFMYHSLKKLGKMIIYTFLSFITTVFVLLMLLLPIFNIKIVNNYLQKTYGNIAIVTIEIFTGLFFIATILFCLYFITITYNKNEVFPTILFITSLYYLTLFNFSMHIYWMIGFNIVFGFFVMLSGYWVIDTFLNIKIKKLEKKQRRKNNQKIEEIISREMGYIPK
jgi:hypothetical protein